MICYEGIWPSLHHGWSQFDALVHDQGATSIVWSVGGTVGTLKDVAKKIATKYNVRVESDTLAVPRSQPHHLARGTYLPPPHNSGRRAR